MPARSVAAFSQSIWLRMATLRRTLRFRLMLWNTAVVALTTLATLFGLRIGVRNALYHEIDALLKEDLENIALEIPEVYRPESTALHGELDRKALSHDAHRWYVRFLRTGEEEIWASQNTPNPRLGFPNAVDFVPMTIGDFRVMQYHENAATPSVIIRVGASLSLINEDLAKIDQLVLLFVGAVLIAAPPVGYWLAGRTTGYLADVIHTAARLHPDQLQERLPLRGTGDELDQLAKTVNLLLDRIARHLEVRRDFLANAAHELRTPLAAIRSSVEVAMGSNRTAGEYEELLGEIIDEGSSLEALVNQLLLLSETEADTLKNRGERFAIDSVVQKAVEMFRGVAEAKDIQLNLGTIDRAEMDGNRQHLRQVLNNLLDNAIKFTPSGGMVVVTLKRNATLPEVTLEVSDSGIGVRAEEIPRLFERFFRADNARRRESEMKGTGLGLSICRAVVEAHGGTISATSELGKGTTFTVVLPLNA